jgi:hypothetical protein
VTGGGNLVWVGVLRVTGMGPGRESSDMMSNKEYFDRCREYSDDLAEKLEAVRKLLKEDPELEAEGAYDKYWDLHNAATTVSMQWQDFCANNKPSGW